MNLLTLDGSSTAIGAAVSPALSKLLDGVLIDDKAECPYKRFDAMLKDVDKLVTQWKPRVILIESPAPQQPAKKVIDKETGQEKVVVRRGQGNYGLAVGRLYEHIKLMHGITPQVVQADVWTNQVPKMIRQEWIAAAYAKFGYDPAKDPGADLSDAIGMAEWWWTRNMVGAAKEN